MKTAHIKKAFTLWKHGIADNYERFFIGIFILKIVFLIVNPDYLPDELVEGNFFISLAIYLAFPLLALYTVICIGYAAFLYLIDLLAYCVEWIRTSGKLILYNRFVWFLAAAGFLNFLVSMIVKSNAPMPVHILFHASATHPLRDCSMEGISDIYSICYFPSFPRHYHPILHCNDDTWCCVFRSCK